MGVVRHKLDLDGGPRRDDCRRGDVAAVSSQRVGIFRSAVKDLDEVVPEEDNGLSFPRRQGESQMVADGWGGGGGVKKGGRDESER